MRLAVAAIARSTFDTALAQRMATAAFEVLETVGAELIGSPSLLVDEDAANNAITAWTGADLDALVILQASFADSTLALALAESTDAPTLLWAFPEDRTGGRLLLNSLCGINLAGFALKRRGRDYRWMYRRPSDPEALTELRRALATPQLPPPALSAVPVPDPEARRKVDEVRRHLSESTIGIVGERPTGFEPCDYDPARLTDVTGIVAESVSLSPLFARARRASDADVAALRAEVAVDLQGLDTLDQSALDQSLRLNLGLSSLVDERGWSAVATRCWPECFTEFGAAACTPQALLSDAGVPACCEADAYGSVTGLILQWLTGSPSFVADLVELDVEDGTGVFWHCGLAPVSLADPEAVATATVHGNRIKPLLNEFPLKPGRVTLARLSQSGGEDRLVIGSGEMLRAPLAFAGTAGVLRFDRPAVDVLDTVMGEGLEHHYGIGYGDVRSELYSLADQLDLAVVAL
jgi:L-fucose isomerase-like protein